MLSEPSSRRIPVQALAVGLCSRVFRGLKTVDEDLATSLYCMSETDRGGYDFPETREELEYAVLLAGVQVGRFYTSSVVKVPSGDLSALWAKSPAGWFSWGSTMVKLKRLGIRRKTNTSFKWESFGLVTTYSDNKYSHVLLGVTQTVSGKLLEGVPDWLVSTLSVDLKPGATYYTRRGESIRVLSPAEQSTVTLVRTSWAVFMTLPGCVVGLKRLCPAPLEPIANSSAFPDAADAAVVLSGGSIMSGNQRWAELVGKQADHEFLLNLAEEFGTFELLREVLRHDIHSRESTTLEWTLSAAKLQNWQQSTGPPLPFAPGPDDMGDVLDDLEQEQLDIEEAEAESSAAALAAYEAHNKEIMVRLRQAAAEGRQVVEDLNDTGMTDDIMEVGARVFADLFSEE
jgi:hypothetical protein